MLTAFNTLRNYTTGKVEKTKMNREKIYLHRLQHFFKAFTINQDMEEHERGLKAREIIYIHFLKKNAFNSLKWAYLNKQHRVLALSSKVDMRKKLTVFNVLLNQRPDDDDELIKIQDGY